MPSPACVRVLAEVPEISIDQFVVATAAASFITLQKEPALVSVSFDGRASLDTYLAQHDLSFVDARISADEIGSRFKFHLFDDLFLRPFCADLLLGSDQPTRATLEDHFISLRRLASVAAWENRQYELAGVVTIGPMQSEFHAAADSLVEFVSALIERRLLTPSRLDALRVLLNELAPER